MGRQQFAGQLKTFFSLRINLCCHVIQRPILRAHIIIFYYFFFLSFFQRKRKAKLKSDGQVNGVDPLGEDDDERVKEIARHFEEKYVSIVFVWNQNITTAFNTVHLLHLT